MYVPVIAENAVEPIRPSEVLAWYVLDQILPPQPNISDLESRPFGRLSHVRSVSERPPFQEIAGCAHSCGRCNLVWQSPLAGRVRGRLENPVLVHSLFQNSDW